MKKMPKQSYPRKPSTKFDIMFNKLKLYGVNLKRKANMQQS